MITIALRAVAQSRGMSLYKLAQVMDKPYQTVYSWADQTKQPTYGNMSLICDTLSCTPGDLFVHQADIPTV